MEDKIRKSNLYKYLNKIDMGEPTFNDEKEELECVKRVKDFLYPPEESENNEECPYDIAYEQIKYSLNKLIAIGYSYLINDYLNVSDLIFRKIKTSPIYKNYNNVCIYANIKTDVGTYVIYIDALYDFLFCKCYENNKLNLSSNDVLKTFDEFKKKYK